MMAVMMMAVMMMVVMMCSCDNFMGHNDDDDYNYNNDYSG